MILPRIITAVIGIPLVVFLIYFGGFPYFLFVEFVVFMSVYEYLTIMKLAQKPIDTISAYLMALIFPLAFYFDGINRDLNIYNFIPLFISTGVILPFLIELFRDEKYIERIAYTVIAIFFIAFNLSYLIPLRNLGFKIIFAIIACVWIMDTVAYIIGSNFGSRKLNSISPKKTLEGFIAAILSSVIFFYLISKFIPEYSVLNLIILALIISFAGQMSDLAESLIKRACGVKDSSNLLPGHGGFLDRFDSYIFIAPIAYYYLILLRH